MPDCLFCSIVRGDVASTTVFEDDRFVAILDIRPVFKGHTLLLPRTHVVTLDELPSSQVGPYFTVVQRLCTAMVDGLGAQGSWVAVNNTVSQSVPHLHTHVVPRTKGDGLRGFFWPRTKYADDADAVAHARRLADALAGG